VGYAERCVFVQSPATTETLPRWTVAVGGAEPRRRAAMSGSNSPDRARRAAVDLILSPPDIRFHNAHVRF
jgi:hypothetical protein